MLSSRPTTTGTGMTAFSSPTSYEEDADGDDGMFSYIPPTTSEGGPRSAGSFARSRPMTGILRSITTAITETYDERAETSPRDNADTESALERNEPICMSIEHTRLEDLAAGPLQQRRREMLEGYTVGKHRHAVNGSPVIALDAHMRLASAGRKGSNFSVNEDKLEAPKDELNYDGGLQPPGTAVSGYTAAMAELDLLDPQDEDSPYPEVRASVSNIDDPEMPALTFRAFVIGLVLATLVAALQYFFSLRYPSPYITPILIQIVSYPLGKVAAHFLPLHVFTMPRWLQYFGASSEWSLNPGPFNVKEHAIIVIMANAAYTVDYALVLTLTLDKYYNIPKGPGFDFLIVLSNQLIGFGLAGITRRFLVKPASMLWPQNLVYCTLFNTFHAEDDDGQDGSMTRFRFFAYVCGGAFAWWFLPGYLFQALSWFNWICWIAPDNVVVNQVFGTITGIGVSFISFDWSQIAYIGSPLVVPWWAEANVFFGFFFFVWFLTPIFYYTNLWNFAYFPISGLSVYDRFGEPYDVKQVLTTDGSFTFNSTAYEGYSPLYLGVSYVTVFSIAFCLATAVIVHTALFHGPTMWRQVRNIRTESDDVHAKLMRVYREVPDWWYWSFIGITFFLGIVAVEVYDTGLPVWALTMAVGLAFIYVLPAGFIYASTTLNVTINILAELIPGYMLPGRPIAVMTFKIYSVQSLQAALSFVQDLKLGHYMKIPPRVTFFSQLVAGIASSVVQIGIKYWLLADVSDLCSPDQGDNLTCPTSHVFFSTSIIWGVVGPMRQLSPGQLYHPLVYWALIGAFLPIPIYLLARRFPNSWVRYINVPVMLSGLSLYPQAGGLNYSSWFLVAFVFQFVVRRRFFRWWSKFNFILSAGLDGGTLICSILIFLCLQLPKNGTIEVDWWGNDVWQNTADNNGTPLLTVPDTGFGPTTWSS